MPSKYVSSFCIMDFETGGLDSKKNPVTEVAMLGITGDTLEEITRFEAYAEYNYLPAGVYSDKAMQVTGILIEDLIEQGMPIKQFVDGVIDTFCQCNAKCQGAYQKVILVGHNFGFDTSFLQQVFTLCKKDLSKYVSGKTDHFGNFQPDYIDTVHLSKMKWQEDDLMENYKLGTVVEKAGLELSDAHRAINDVIANKEVFVSFINDLRYGDGTGISVKKAARLRNHYHF